MIINKLKPFIPVSNIIIPSAGIKNQHYCLIHMSENTSFLDCYRYMQIKRSYVKHVMVPNIQKPRSRLTPTIKKALRNHKLFPVPLVFGSYEKYSDINYYLDFNYIIETAIGKWNFTKYNTGKGLKFIKSIVNTANGIPQDTHVRTLLYTVNLNNHIPDKFFSKRIYPVYDILSNKEPFPFDLWLCYYFNEDGGNFIKLWDRNQQIPLPRIKNFLMKIKTINPEVVKNDREDNIVTKTTEHISKNKEEVQTAVKQYMKVDKSFDGMDPNDIDSDDISAKAVVYNITGDVDKAKDIINKISTKEKKKIIDDNSEQLLKKDKASTQSKNTIIKLSNVPKLVDNLVPTHILDKRKKDFDVNLKIDLNNIFKTLENKEVPFQVLNVEKKLVKSPSSELRPSLKDQYNIMLKGPRGKHHDVRIELPHLTENGTFLINGRQRVLINQLITYPIFFFKPFFGQLSTVYSSVTINSKQVKKGPYLLGYIGGYKIPLILILMYKLGAKRTNELFNIKTKVHEKKPSPMPIIEEGKGYILKTVNGRYIEIYTKTEETLQLVYGLRYIMESWPRTKLGEDPDIHKDEFWRKTLVKFTGTRNSVYIIDEVWKNILTPIEIEVLKSHGDPTTLDKIFKHISEEVVQGRVDDRNSLDRQRVRTSEVFSALILKQINAAYNEFLSKHLGGDDEVKFELNATKTFSDVITSQNVQLLENINPCEEISMMTRVTPVGVGGIPDRRAVSNKAMSTHYTYYGNIDPLETPDGPSVGILQHLSVGASIINKRGQFAIKDPSTVKPGEILSVGPAMIPFVESCDGNRVIMAAGQIKQAVPLLDNENPAVQTGYETVITPLLSDNFVKKCRLKNGGEIVSIDKHFIKIKSAGGKIESVPLQPRLLKSGQGKNGISVFTPTVKIGQKVKHEQMIAEGGSIKNGMISIGVNMLVALMPWKGYNFEDGVVMSESAAAKLTSIHLDEVNVYLAEDEDVIFIAEEGDTIKKGGVVLTYSSSVSDIEAHRHTRIDGGKLETIEVYSNTTNIPDRLMVDYERTKEQYTTIRGEYPQGKFKEKNEKFEGILIKFTIRQELKIRRGDKINNRHFNKGVVSIIEKDEDMPMTPWGDRVEMCLQPISIINRMINSQILEVLCGLMSWKLGQEMKNKTRAQFMNIYKRAAPLIDGTDNKAYSKSMIQKLTALSDVAWKSLIQEITTNRFFPIIIPPFKTPDREDILKALGVLGLQSRYSLDIPGYGKTKETVTVGYFYKTKLEHMAEKKLATRAAGGAYAGKTLAPVKRKGETAQKLGEHDMYSLLSWDMPQCLEEFFGPSSSDHVTKGQIISEIIHTGKGTFRETKTNPVKDLFAQYMLAIHLESM